MSVSTDNELIVVLDYTRKTFGKIAGRSDRTWADVYGDSAQD